MHTTDVKLDSDGADDITYLGSSQKSNLIWNGAYKLKVIPLHIWFNRSLITYHLFVYNNQMWEYFWYVLLTLSKATIGSPLFYNVLILLL